MPADDRAAAPQGAVQPWARRAHLPDLGADLRLQPGLRALPQLVGPARPGRADARRGPGHRRRPGRHEGLLRQHRRRRADAAAGLLRPRLLRRRAPGRGQVLDQRDPAHARARPPAGRPRLPRRADQHRRCHRGHQRRRARRGLLRRRPARHGQPRRGRLRPVQDQRGRDPPQRRGARRAGRHRRLLRRPAAADPAAPLGPRRRHLGRAAPDRGAAAHALPLAARAARRADGRLLLPPLGPGRAARRAEPLRGRPGRLPHRSRRRRLRLPLRHRPPVPGRQRPRRRAASPPSGASPRSSPRCASRRAPGPAPRAAPSTPAGAGAWRPSSSPACRSTGRTPSACTATARRRWRRSGDRPQSVLGHSKVGRDGTPIPVPTPVRFRSPARA